MHFSTLQALLASSAVATLAGMLEYTKPEATGYTCLQVLTLLYGLPWDEYAMNWVDTLRPSRVRVSTNGWVNSDAMHWRVTVYVDEHQLIQRIVQEVVVGLRGGLENGHEARLRLADAVRCEVG